MLTAITRLCSDVSAAVCVCTAGLINKCGGAVSGRIMHNVEDVCVDEYEGGLDHRGPKKHGPTIHLLLSKVPVRLFFLSFPSKTISPPLHHN